jgi:hypothetical protein
VRGSAHSLNKNETGKSSASSQFNLIFLLILLAYTNFANILGPMCNFCIVSLIRSGILPGAEKMNNCMIELKIKESKVSES